MCRELKNFSSLRAVISGLQAHPVHRLKRIWQLVPHRLSHLMKELEQINTKDSILKVRLTLLLNFFSVDAFVSLLLRSINNICLANELLHDFQFLQQILD